ncbi:arabinosylfuranosidase ArfA [Bifidobacterium sp. ESL0820]|uniref:arabinosylfuranosidase ArfA n=1 Tax=Bifidobacterium sp. ESL0820 TaxID=3448586 RepID=UPI004041AF63
MEVPNSGKNGWTQLIIEDRDPIGSVNNRLFGSFVEHLGRCVYTGIYEPGHPSADDDGYRSDVMELVKELGVTTIRYPGGNFVSGYRWRDGIGDPSKRPRRLDLAWHSTETNEFGLHEMVKWLAKLGGNELMEAVNLGTQGTQEALDLLEYANIPSGTALSELRRANGRDAPFGIRMWCLGNEMDGPWQLGHRKAHEYARIAAITAAGMRQIDPDIELAVCGSSSHSMPTFGSWERTVLEETYENINFISAHAYYQPVNNDMASFLASGNDMDGFIKDVGSIIDATKAQLKSKHDVFISFDEWNIWYQNAEQSQTPMGIDNWPVAPHLLEDVYTVADAVAFGDLLITLLRNADRVHSASLAQLVNVIAPIMTAPGGRAWRQTTFYPFSQAAHLSKGGTVVRGLLTGSRHPTDRYGEVSDINAVPVLCADGSLAIFAVNRSLDRSNTLTLDIGSDGSYKTAGMTTLHEEDYMLANTRDAPDRVFPRRNKQVEFLPEQNKVVAELAPVSWNVIHVS